MSGRILPVVMAMLFVSSLFAERVNRYFDGSDQEDRIQHLEKRLDEATEERESGEVGGKNPSARGCPPNEGFFMEADLLVWRAQNQGFVFAFDRVPPVDTLGGEATVYNGELKEIDENWRPGFRIGLGWNADYDNWDLFTNWTWYRNKSMEKVTATDFSIYATPTQQSGLIPLFDNRVGTAFKKGHGKWRLLYNTLDFELGRAYYITKAVSFHPHVGLRAGWLYQTFTSNFKEKHEEVESSPNEVGFHGKNNYWGIGPRFGVDGDWHLGRGFSLFGKISGAVLYGRVTEFSKGFLESEGSMVQVTDQSHKFSDLVPNLQLALGLGWGSCFHEDKFYFATNLSWEANYWWNQFNIPPMLVDFEGGALFPLAPGFTEPLSLEGVTLNFELHF